MKKKKLYYAVFKGNDEKYSGPYTAAALEDLKSDRATLRIIDAETGEIVYDKYLYLINFYAEQTARRGWVVITLQELMKEARAPFSVAEIVATIRRLADLDCKKVSPVFFGIVNGKPTVSKVRIEGTLPALQIFTK